MKFLKRRERCLVTEKEEDTNVCIHLKLFKEIIKKNGKKKL